MPHSNFRCNRLWLKAFCPQFTNPSLLLGRHCPALWRNTSLAQDHSNRVVADAVALSKLGKARTSGDVCRDDGLPVSVIDPANESATRGPSG